MRFLHVDLHAFLVAVERQRRPDLHDRPLVVGGRPAGGGLVAAASREARRAGIRPGMPLAQAAVRCPAAAFVEGSVDRYLAAAADIDAVLRRESPEIEWASVDEVFVGFGGIEAGPLVVQAAERLRGDVGSLGFDAACGIARTKLVAAIASRLARPRGVLHVLDGYEARFLAPFKIEMLPDMDPALVRRLRAAGIRRLGQLAQTSEADLLRITGRTGGTLILRAGGIDRSGIERLALPPRRISDARLRAPTSEGAVVHDAVACEIGRVGRQLRSRAVFARTLTLRIRFADGRTESRTAPLPEPASLDEALSPAAFDLLSRVWDGERMIAAVNVSCGGLLAGAAEGALFSA
ncbi:MAG TPA: hypothetical protein VGL62_10210 [Vicinamibacterales bacterium]